MNLSGSAICQSILRKRKYTEHVVKLKTKLRSYRFSTLSIAETDSTLLQNDKSHFCNFIITSSNAITNVFPKKAEWFLYGIAVVRTVKTNQHTKNGYPP